jgi:uncharacterized alpha-E superfamily protein
MVTPVQQRGRTRALAEKVYATVTASDAFALAETSADESRPGLIALLDEIESAMTRIADAVGDAYLQHLPRYRA